MRACRIRGSNQIGYILIDTRAVLDSSGKPFVGLAGSDFKFGVAEQVVVPNGTGTFPAGETSTATTIVVLFVELVQLAGGIFSLHVALWGRAGVLCGENIMIRKGLQIGHHDCHNAGLYKLRASGRWHGARAGQISKVDLVLPSGPTGMDPLQTSFFRLLSMGTKMVGPGASQIVLYLATVALMDGASIFIASDTGAVTVSPLGGVALVCPVIFSVVALDSEEPIEDLLYPDVGSTGDVSSDMAFCFNERIVASTSGSKMVRVMACGMKVAIPSGQCDRVPVLAPGSSVPVDPTADLAHGSEVSVIVGEGAFLDMAQTEFVKARCEPASVPRARARQEGAQCTTSEIREMQSYDREFALGNRRDTSRRVIRDQSVAEETISAPGVRSQARRTNYKALEV